MKINRGNWHIRWRMGAMGIALLVLRLLMEACVSGAAVIQMILQMFRQTPITEESMNRMLMGNGWGYLVCVALGLLLVLAWQGGAIFPQIFQRGKAMGVGDFFQLLCLCLGTQVLCQVYAQLLELLLNCFGLSAVEQMNQASLQCDTISMYLYACVIGPLWEEFVFRGVIQRSMEMYGKRFAILTSAFLFGMFHGNIIQIPFAFLFGLILGYVAQEHGILWAMVLHMFNNLVLSDLLSRLPEPVGSVILLVLLPASAIASLVILLVNWPRVRAYHREYPMRARFRKLFVTAPGILVFCAVMVLYAGMALAG